MKIFDAKTDAIIYFESLNADLFLIYQIKELKY